jgi:hypothetical protein
LRDGGKTFKELGEIFGVSKQSVSQTYYRAVNGNKNYLDLDNIKRKNLAAWIKLNYNTLDDFCKRYDLVKATVKNILKAKNNPNYAFCELVMSLVPPDTDFLEIFEVD